MPRVPVQEKREQSSGATVLLEAAAPREPRTESATTSRRGAPAGGHQRIHSASWRVPVLESKP